MLSDLLSDAAVVDHEPDRSHHVAYAAANRSWNSSWRRIARRFDNGVPSNMVTFTLSDMGITSTPAHTQGGRNL